LILINLAQGSWSIFEGASWIINGGSGIGDLDNYQVAMGTIIIVIALTLAGILGSRLKVPPSRLLLDTYCSIDGITNKQRSPEVLLWIGVTFVVLPVIFFLGLTIFLGIENQPSNLQGLISSNCGSTNSSMSADEIQDILFCQEYYGTYLSWFLTRSVVRFVFQVLPLYLH
jgi:hypothetical protein